MNSNWKTSKCKKNKTDISIDAVGSRKKNMFKARFMWWCTLHAMCVLCEHCVYTFEGEKNVFFFLAHTKYDRLALSHNSVSFTEISSKLLDIGIEKRDGIRLTPKLHFTEEKKKQQKTHVSEKKNNNFNRICITIAFRNEYRNSVNGTDKHEKEKILAQK